MKKLMKAVLAFALVLSMTGCGQNNKTTYNDGSYRASAQGFGGNVEVTLKIEGNKITEVEIQGANETENIGQAAFEELKGAILEAQKAEFDGVSGATLTSDAVKSAVQKALEQASGATGEEGSATVKDGKYSTKAMGHEGYIYVTTMFRDGQIASCTVTSQEETIGIGNYATSRIPGRIVEAQSLNVDSVSGATVSSNAVIRAVSEAIELAGGKVEDFQKEVVKEEIVPETVEENVDVVIMGAGTAGLIAGARLLEQGKNVLIFEKEDIPGGAMATTYSGIMSSGSELIANYGVGREQANPYYSKEMLLKVFENYIHPEHDRFNKAQPYQNAMMDASATLVDWLHEIGVGFAPLGTYPGLLQYGYTPYLAPGCYRGGAGYAMMYLADRIEALGGRIIYSTPVTDLVQDENGRVTGLVAEGEDGKTWNVSADAVLLASGGFASNQEMVDKYYPQYAGSVFNANPGSTGDGIILGEKVGAAIECMGRDLGAFMSAYGSNYELAFMHSSTPGIIVNVKGDQFGNIMKSNHKTLATALMDPANEKTFYYIFDDSAVASTINNNAYGFSYEPIFDRGEAVRYDSVAQAAEELGLENLQATLDTHNAHALAGEKDEFGRGNLPYIETRDGVWAIRVIPTFYLTTGGLAIDTEARVLDADGQPIKGLYAAGDVTGSIEEKDGKEYGNGFDAAMTYGVIVADTIVNETK